MERGKPLVSRALWVSSGDCLACRFLLRGEGMMDGYVCCTMDLLELQLERPVFLLGRVRTASQGDRFWVRHDAARLDHPCFRFTPSGALAAATTGAEEEAREEGRDEEQAG